MLFVMTIAERPKSLQAQRKQGYQARIQEEARARFSGSEPLAGDLYVRIIWFHSTRAETDVDNIVKPILDALAGVVYANDNQIIKCVSERIDTTKDFILSEYPASPATQVYEELLLRISDDQIKHVLYIEIGELNVRRIVFGPIDGA